MAKILKKRILPFDGRVLVDKGDIVKPETLVAEMFYIGERPFIVNIADRLKVGLTEIEEYLTKKVGDTVNAGEIIAVRKTLGARMLADSPVSGVLEYISPASGGVIIREKIGKDEIGPVTINCAKALDIPPESLEIHLNKHIGEKVEKGGVIASMSMYAGIAMKYCRSPIYGEVVDINLKTGDVVIKRPVEERKLNASIPGIIKEIIPKRGVIIETEAEVFYGVFGFGGERWGRLGTDIIIFDKPVKRKEFESLRGKVQGIITPSISVMEFDDIFGDEIRKGITKENDTGITMILMEGFGRLKLDNDLKKKLNKYKGKFVTIDGRTQIRAGVRRPQILIPTT
ncbi:hypothetical protein J7L85_04925 [candidate division WOR-3 bacterium]|nr:hypothetical protein [candidate division WOR-3 bacterium]